LFFSVSTYLARACLGKKIIFLGQNGARKRRPYVFRTERTCRHGFSSCKKTALFLSFSYVCPEPVLPQSGPKWPTSPVFSPVAARRGCIYSL
jgi:hypothetical protein